MGEIRAKPSRHDYLRRLSPESYCGFSMVHWSMAVAGRRTGWLDAGSHSIWREVLLHTLARYDLAAPVYCLMPDHAHLVLAGLSLGSDQRKAVSFLRRYTAPIFAGVGAQWQKQAYDHVLGENERSRGSNGFSAVLHYIAENPVRAGLAENTPAWRYSGSVIAGWPDLDWRQPDFEMRWWELYAERTEAAEAKALPLRP